MATTQNAPQGRLAIKTTLSDTQKTARRCPIIFIVLVNPWDRERDEIVV